MDTLPRNARPQRQRIGHLGRAQAGQTIARAAPTDDADADIGRAHRRRCNVEAGHLCAQLSVPSGWPRVAFAASRFARAGVGVGLGVGIGTTATMFGMGPALPRVCATLSVLCLGVAAVRLGRRAMARDDDARQRNALHGAMQAAVATQRPLSEAEAVRWLASHTLWDLTRLCDETEMRSAGAFPTGNRHLAAAELTKCLVAPTGEPVDQREAMRKAAASALQGFGMPQNLTVLLAQCDFEYAYPLVLGYLRGRCVDAQAIDAAVQNAGTLSR